LRFKGTPVSCDFRRTIIGNTPKAHTKVDKRRVLGRIGKRSAFKTLNAEIPPAFHVLQKIVDVHRGRIDRGRIS